jgi:hypothetical protein
MEFGTDQDFEQADDSESLPEFHPPDSDDHKSEMKNQDNPQKISHGNIYAEDPTDFGDDQAFEQLSDNESHKVHSPDSDDIHGSEGGTKKGDAVSLFMMEVFNLNRKEWQLHTKRIIVTVRKHPTKKKTKDNGLSKPALTEPSDFSTWISQFMLQATIILDKKSDRVPSLQKLITWFEGSEGRLDYRQKEAFRSTVSELVSILLMALHERVLKHSL